MGPIEFHDDAGSVESKPAQSQFDDFVLLGLDASGLDVDDDADRSVFAGRLRGRDVVERQPAQHSEVARRLDRGDHLGDGARLEHCSRSILGAGPK
jgi:hypothetical protein